jgi:hypothetical protein
MEIAPFVGLDVHNRATSVGIAESGRGGEVRFLGEIPSSPETLCRLVEQLKARHRQLSFCYEAAEFGRYRVRRRRGQCARQHVCEQVRVGADLGAGQGRAERAGFADRRSLTGPGIDAETGHGLRKAEPAFAGPQGDLIGNAGPPAPGEPWSAATPEPFLSLRRQGLWLIESQR